jgi:hypothetical protein
MLRSREAWHALDDARSAAASGSDSAREALLRHAHTLQHWPSCDSPIIGIFCADDLLPRLTENNVRFLLHTLQHTEQEWKQPVFGFFQEIFQRSWDELLDHYKITNDDHSVKKLTRTLEMKFRAKVWWYIHNEIEKKRESAAASASSVESALQSSNDPAIVAPAFIFSNFDTVSPGVLS